MEAKTQQTKKFETIKKKNIYILILGDFNIPSFETELSQRGKEDLEPEAEALYDFLEVNNLISHNAVKNTNGKTLDLVLSDVLSTKVERILSLVSKEDLHHPSLDVILQLSRHSHGEEKIVGRVIRYYGSR